MDDTSRSAPPRLEGGPSDFDLPVGPVRLGLRGVPVAWDSFLAPRYETFALEPDPAAPPTLLVRCSVGSGVCTPLPPRGGETVLEVERQGERVFVLRSHWHEARLDLAAGEATVVFTDLRADRFDMSLENFLRVAAQLHLIEHGAFLFHGAGVLHEGRVVLLFGPSGAGKSTATRLSAPRLVLSDDMVILDARDGRAYASTVPFHMKLPASERHRGRHPLAAACRLRQAPHDSIADISPARAVATLSASIPYVHEFGVEHEGLTKLVAAIAAQIPVIDLHFTKSARFWDALGDRLDR